MTYSEIGFIFLIASFLIQCFYLFYFSARVAFIKENKIVDKKGITVIICARNENENLKNNLPLILNQKYDDFEVVVVNDRSWDDSIEILNNFKAKYPNLKIVDIPDNKTDNFGKKLAITIGIKAAKNNYLLFTDADCKPLSEHWINEMSKGFEGEKQIVIGVGIYEKELGFLNKIIRFDTVQIAINSLGYAKAKLAYMGVGRNLAYHQDIYYLNDGFKSHYHIESGDDDLFVNQASNKRNTQVIFSSKGMTISKPKKELRKWIYQKRRHHTTNFKYKKKHKFLLGLQYLSALAFYFLLIFSFLSDNYIKVGLILFTLRYLLIIAINYKAFKIMMCKDLLWVFPIYEIILLFCQPIFLINRTIKL
jgi:glycosyltransferase involved in cell wall biosynthesis